MNNCMQLCWSLPFVPQAMPYLKQPGPWKRSRYRHGKKSISLTNGGQFVDSFTSIWPRTFLNRFQGPGCSGYFLHNMLRHIQELLMCEASSHQPARVSITVLKSALVRCLSPSLGPSLPSVPALAFFESFIHFTAGGEHNSAYDARLRHHPQLKDVQRRGYIAPILEVVGCISYGAASQEHASRDDGILPRFSDHLPAKGFIVAIITHGRWMGLPRWGMSPDQSPPAGLFEGSWRNRPISSVSPINPVSWFP